MSDKTTGNIQVNFNDVDDFQVLGSRPSSNQSSGKTESGKSGDEDEEENEKQDDDNTDDSAEEEEDENQEEEEESEESDEDEDSADTHESDEDGQEIELSEDQVEDIISERFGGLNASEIEQRLAELDALKNAPPAPKFPSESHKKLYEFVSKYSGNDFENGIVRFARLSSLDVEKLTPKDAQKELFILEHKNLSREKAEKLFEHEFNQEFEAIDDDDIRETKLELKGDQAKEKLLQMQQETKPTQTESEVNTHVEARNKFLDGVKQSFEDFDLITIAMDDDPNSEFNFEIENKDLIMESMADVNTHFQNAGWVQKDDKGNLVYNFDKMKADYAFIYNKEKILESYYSHGKEAGKDEILAEIENRTPKGKKPTKNSQKGGPKTAEEAMNEAIMNLPDESRRKR